MMVLANGRPLPAVGLPKVPELDDRVFAVHYSTQLLADCPASTPQVSALVVRQVVSGFEVPFAAFKVAERRRLPPEAVRTAGDELEAELLAGFYDFVARQPDAVWLNWTMGGNRFGFSTLAHRFELRHGHPPPLIECDRQFDLHSFLKRAAGPDFAPDPRFPATLAMNGLTNGLLDAAAAAAAWRGGHYTRLLDSLTAKVRGLVGLFERLWRGELQTAKGRIGVAGRRPRVAVAKLRGPTPAAANVEARADGPKDPHHFQYGGNESPITPGQCYRLLQAMWGKESVETAYLAEYVLYVKEESVRTYLNRLNLDLHDAGYPFRLARTDRGRCVVWTERA